MSRLNYVLALTYVCFACRPTEGFTSLYRQAASTRQTVWNAPVEADKNQLTPEYYSTRGGSLNAWPLSRDPKGMSPDYPLAAARIGITIASTYLTWYAQGQYSNVMASSAFALICSMLFDRRLGQAAFCGSFAGMCSTAIVPTTGLALQLGVLTAIFFEIIIHYWNAFLGIGGRLGMTAFLATSVIAAQSGVSTGIQASAMTINSLTKTSLCIMALWHAIGAVATIALREASDESSAADPVRASAVIGLAGGLLLKDKTAALALYGGSFVGMSLPSRLLQGILPKKGTSPRHFTVASILSAFAAAGALGGLVHGITLDWNMWPGGWGGKAGSCAFVGCLLFRLLSKTISTVRQFIRPSKVNLN
mmetsp:Transcript_12395/g.18170  ORF Transcript_12395/g.18170 Transcript_12395/m.18170 type:complete len:363 (-) Transcript_12395:19-1107(-)